MTHTDQALRKILRYRRVAVVGLSSKPWRPSYGVARYLQSVGYHIFPVNPNVDKVLGEVAYPSLFEVPKPVEVVDVFRHSEAVPGVIEEAIACEARAIWLQEGVIHEQAARQAQQAGLLVVMDRCMLKEHRRLMSV